MPPGSVHRSRFPVLYLGFQFPVPVYIFLRAGCRIDRFLFTCRLFFLMPSGKSVYKAGKLLKIHLEYDSGMADGAQPAQAIIRSIRITGDFFLYPEEGIEALQQQLIGTKLTKDALTGQINQILTNEHLEPFGFNSEQLAEAILEACRQ